MPFIGLHNSWIGLLVWVTVGISSGQNLYSHEWAVEIDGGEQTARSLADKHNFDYLGNILGDYYHFKHRHVSKRSIEPAVDHHEILLKEPQVRWAEQQKVLRRKKRDFQATRHISLKRGLDTHTVLTDPKWSAMWYLNRGGGLDMNVEKAWSIGATGKGVVVTILDDGLEKDHPDLLQNYDPQASYDVNSRDGDPMPRYDARDTNRHGTRCAGEVAAVANNSNCAVGVAYEASVGGVRMLDGDVTDAVEASSLSLNPNHIDIYSASWGPDDDGKTVDGPGQMATRAFMEGVKNGRNGKGSIFVWASGNGGRDKDNCNCDGYTNAIWTLSISSATEKGKVPWYSEACSSTLASTYSSGSFGERQIITTDLHHKCTNHHTGTSASAPLAAGICALALHANRDLTWRDMQHIVVRTARPEHLDADDWQTNGVGRKVSHRFGYGIMDAHKMVELARNWTTVPRQDYCTISAPHVDKLVPQQSFVILDLEVSQCSGVNFLEHVQAKVSLTAHERGKVEIFLVSPAGTRSHLLALRPKDGSRRGFHSWPFMTVHMWGEQPFGIWKLEIHNSGGYYAKVTAQDWSLSFYGTEVEPGTQVASSHSEKDRPLDINEHSSHSSHSSEGNPEEREKDNEMSVTIDGVRSSGSSVAPSVVSRKLIPNLPLPVGCVSVNESGSCIECKQTFYQHDGSCVSVCPGGFRPEEGPYQKYCLDCHYSCQKCSGPLDYECTECWPDATIYSPKQGESYCYSKYLLNYLQLQESLTRVSLGIMIFLAASICLLGIIITLIRRKSARKVPTVTAPAKAPFTKLTSNYLKLDNKETHIQNMVFEDLSSSDEEIG